MSTTRRGYGLGGAIVENVLILRADGLFVTLSSLQGVDHRVTARFLRAKSHFSKKFFFYFNHQQTACSNLGNERFSFLVKI